MTQATERWRQRREEERRRAREAKRAEAARQADLERRREAEREAQRQEERRQAALEWQREQEARAEAQRARRQALRRRLRRARRVERREAARIEQVRQGHREEAQLARREEVRAQAQAEARAEALREAAFEARHEEAQALAKAQAQAEALREATLQARREEAQAQAQAQAQAEALREAALQARRDEAQALALAESRREQALQARRDEAQAVARAQAQAEACREQALQARREEAQALEQAQAQAEARREAVLQARREEARALAQAEKRSEALREAARQARRDEVKAQEQARAAADVRAEERASAAAEARGEEARRNRRQAVLEETRRRLRQEELAAERRAGLRQNSLQAARSQARGEARGLARRTAARQEATRREAPARGGQRLPSGRISHDLPWLHTAGPRILDEYDSMVVPRGLVLPGFLEAVPVEGQDVLDAAGLGGDTVGQIVDTWQANIIRIPLDQTSLLRGRGSASSPDFFRGLDELIGAAAASGAYTLLSLVWIDAEREFGSRDGEANHVAPLPDAQSGELWRRLVDRYEDEPSVLYDIYSLPHDPLPDDPMSGDMPAVSWPVWSEWARALVGLIRGRHPRSLIFVSGLDWASDLSGFPLRFATGDPIHNLVYAMQLYPWRVAAGWQTKISRLAVDQPVFVTEWGGYSAHSGWGSAVAAFLAGQGIGWTAAAWGGQPPLAVERMGRYGPTAFGRVVSRALTAPYPAAQRSRGWLPARASVGGHALAEQAPLGAGG